eukprot:551445-Prymnesium_polylepis.1
MGGRRHSPPRRLRVTPGGASARWCSDRRPRAALPWCSRAMLPVSAFPGGTGARAGEARGGRSRLEGRPAEPPPSTSPPSSVCHPPGRLQPPPPSSCLPGA